MISVVKVPRGTAIIRHRNVSNVCLPFDRLLFLHAQILVALKHLSSALHWLVPMYSEYTCNGIIMVSQSIPLGFSIKDVSLD